jgi:DNA-binding Lrp family transcriptional regulator
MDLDATALRVLDVLVGDGRAGPREIAAAADLTVPQVIDALERLEMVGVVEGYEPRLDYGPLGYRATAVARLRVDDDAVDAVRDRLVDDPVVRTVYEVTGDTDLLAVVTVADRDALCGWVGGLSTDPTVRSVSTDLVTGVLAEGRSFPTEGA